MVHGDRNVAARKLELDSRLEVGGWVEEEVVDGRRSRGAFSNEMSFSS